MLEKCNTDYENNFTKKIYEYKKKSTPCKVVSAIRNRDRRLCRKATVQSHVMETTGEEVSKGLGLLGPKFWYRLK